VRIVDHYRVRISGRWQRLVTVDVLPPELKAGSKVRAPDGRVWNVWGLETGAMPLAHAGAVGLYLKEQEALPAVGEELELVT
jgi:hypothetical protein